MFDANGDVLSINEDDYPILHTQARGGTYAGQNVLVSLRFSGPFPGIVQEMFYLARVFENSLASVFATPRLRV